METVVERCTVPGPQWLRLRRDLWPHCPDDEHAADMARLCAEPERYAQFIATDATGAAIGLAEASLRRDYVIGTTTSPVGFLEGIYVAPAARRRGVARQLVEHVERWARASGCRELASDALLENRSSHEMHEALGFAECDRVVCFRKDLA